MATPTITSTLESISKDVSLNALALAFPPVGVVLKIPVIGPLVRAAFNFGMNWLIVNGVIDIKIGVIALMDDAARAKYAAQMPVLLAMQKEINVPTEQQTNYENALQDAIKNHPGVVNA